MQKTPYLQVVDMPRMMGGKGAPRSTIFGALGRTQYDPYTRTLGGLIVTTTPGKKPKETMKASAEHHNTDHCIIGPAAKTHVPGEHYGQVPYPGAFRSHLGPRL